MSWKSIIEGLSKKKLSQAQIAELCECGQATISDLAKGSTADPRYRLGIQLTALDELSEAELQDLLAARRTAASNAAMAPAGA